MSDSEGSSLVTVSCADYTQYLVIALQNLFHSKLKTDFELSLGGKSARAHKIILELFLASETIGVFEKKQRVPLVEQEESEIENTDGWKCLESILEFLYTGKVTVPADNLKELMELAKELDFTMLVDAIVASREPKVIEGVDSLTVKVENDSICSENSSDVEEFVGVAIGDYTSSKNTFRMGGEDLTSSSEEAHSLFGTETAAAKSCFENIDKVARRQIVPCSPRVPAGRSGDIAEDVNSSYFGLPKFKTEREFLDDRKFQESISQNSRQLLKHAVKIKSELEECVVDMNSEFCGSFLEGAAGGSADIKTMQCSGNSIDSHVEVEVCLVDDSTQVDERAIKSFDNWVADLDSGPSENNTYNQGIDDNDSKLGDKQENSLLPNSKSYRCSHCDFETDKYRKYWSHLRSVHRTTAEEESASKYKCQHCQFEAPNYVRYYRHLWRVHKLTVQGKTIEKQKCAECDYTSESLAALKAHCLAKHCKERPFSCQYCSFAGKRTAQLARHLNVVHGLGDSRFICQTCGQRCTCRASLEHHTRIHTNDRQYKCPHCCYASIRKDCLRNHMLAVHSKDLLKDQHS